MSEQKLSEAILKGAKLENTCVSFYKMSKHNITQQENMIYIGCEKHTLDYWLENYVEIGKRNEYTDEEIEEYGKKLEEIQNSKNEHTGSDFDTFLKSEDIYDEVSARAAKRTTVHKDEETGEVFLDLEDLVGPDVSSEVKYYTMEVTNNEVGGPQITLTFFDKDKKRVYIK